jgi:hypothetical protein
MSSGNYRQSEEDGMVISTPSSSHHATDTSLAAAIGDAGRRTSARTLGLILLGGSVGIVATLLLLHGHRMMAVPFVMPVTFGIWGLAVHGERTLARDGPDTKIERTLLRALRLAMVVLGATAAVATVYAITFALTGSGGLQLR